jgi:hypothetical protein
MVAQIMEFAKKERVIVKMDIQANIVKDNCARINVLKMELAQQMYLKLFIIKRVNAFATMDLLEKFVTNDMF